MTPSCLIASTTYSKRYLNQNIHVSEMICNGLMNSAISCKYHLAQRSETPRSILTENCYNPPQLCKADEQHQ